MCVQPTPKFPLFTLVEVYKQITKSINLPFEKKFRFLINFTRKKSTHLDKRSLFLFTFTPLTQLDHPTYLYSNTTISPNININMFSDNNKPVHFYRAGGTYGCFSNFSLHPVLLKGKSWPTSEHYFQVCIKLFIFLKNILLYYFAKCLFDLMN